MRVLMVSHYFDSHQGGIELVARRIFRGLGRPDCDVVWAAADVSASPEGRQHARCLPLRVWNGVERMTGVPFPAPTLGAVKQLFAALKTADVILLHDCLYLTNIVTFLLARVRRKPVIIVQHIGMVPHRNLLLRAAMALGNLIFTRSMLRSAQQVVFISEITKRYFGAIRFRRPPLLLFNGVDSKIFHPVQTESDQQASRRRFGLPVGKPVALFAGRFVEKKGLRILCEMAAQAPHVSWAFAGSGPMNPQGWKLDNVYTFINLSQEDLAALYRASDAFILPSVGEGFPLVLQEALACGLPIVCGSETAAADAALSPFVQGVAFDLANTRQAASAFLAAMEEVLSHKEPYPDGARKRHEVAQARYCWQQVVDRYFEIARGLANESGSPSSATTPSNAPSVSRSGGSPAG